MLENVELGGPGAHGRYARVCSETAKLWRGYLEPHLAPRFHGLSTAIDRQLLQYRPWQIVLVTTLTLLLLVTILDFFRERTLGLQEKGKLSYKKKCTPGALHLCEFQQLLSVAFFLGEAQVCHASKNITRQVCCWWAVLNMCVEESVKHFALLPGCCKARDAGMQVSSRACLILARLFLESGGLSNGSRPRFRYLPGYKLHWSR